MTDLYVPEWGGSVAIHEMSQSDGEEFRIRYSKPDWGNETSVEDNGRILRRWVVIEHCHSDVPEIDYTKFVVVQAFTPQAAWLVARPELDKEFDYEGMGREKFILAGIPMWSIHTYTEGAVYPNDNEAAQVFVVGKSGHVPAHP